METESAKTLPKTLPGVVCEQWKRCGARVADAPRGICTARTSIGSGVKEAGSARNTCPRRYSIK